MSSSRRTRAIISRNRRCREKDGRTYFTLAVTKPDTRPSSGGLHYTLVTDQGAVSGMLPFF